MINALAIDTTSDYLSLALLKAGRPAGEHYALSRTRTEQTLLATVHRLLTAAELTPRALEAIFVARGPGSFTGTRIGLAVALTFGQVAGTPVLGVDTLQLLAAQTDPAEARAFHVMLNCTRDEVYHAPFRWRDGQPLALAPLALAPMATMAGELGETPVVLRRFEPVQPGHEALLAGLRRLPLRREFPDGTLLLEVGLGHLRALGGAPPPRVEPIYLKSEAFRKWQG